MIDVSMVMERASVDSRYVIPIIKLSYPSPTYQKRQDQLPL
jgi:hypothetical protein